MKITKLTKQQVSEAMRHIGQLGGKARHLKLSHFRRKAIARAGAIAMHRKNGHKLRRT